VRQTAKLQVSLENIGLFHRAVLQKRVSVRQTVSMVSV